MQWRIQEGRGHDLSHGITYELVQLVIQHFWSQKMDTPGNYINTVKRPSNGEQITGNSSSFRHTKRCKIMHKMHQNTLGGRALPEPTGGVLALPQTP